MILREERGVRGITRDADRFRVGVFQMTMTEKRAEVGHGVVASLAASTAMSVMLGVTHKLGLLGEPPPRKLTRKIASLLGLAHVPRGASLFVATTAAHYAYGAGIGALFGGAIAPRASTRQKRVALGIATGAAVWAASYQGWIPGLGLMKPPSRDRPLRPSLMLAAHCLFGAVMGAVYRPPRFSLPKTLPLTESELLDLALAESFPASDPPSMTQPRRHL